MADPLGVAGTIVGIVSLGLTVSKGLTTFIEAVRDAPEDLKAVQNDLSALCEVLEQIKDVLTLPGARLSERPLRSALANCSENFTDINARLESASVYIREKRQQQQGATGIKITRLARVTLSRNEHMRWFYKQGTIEKLRVNFNHSKLTLLLAVNIAELYRVEKERRAQVETKNQPSMVDHPGDSTTTDTSRDITMVSPVGSIEPDGSDTTERPADTQQSDSPTIQSATETTDIVDRLNMKRGLDANQQQVEVERSQLVDTVLSLQKQVDRLKKHVAKRDKGRVKQNTPPANLQTGSEAGEGAKSETADAEQISSAETSLGSGHQITSDIPPSASLSEVIKESSSAGEILKLWMMNLNIPWEHEGALHLSIKQANIPQKEIQGYLQAWTTSESRGVLYMLRKLNGAQRDSILTNCRKNRGEIRLIEEWETTRVPAAIGAIEMVNLAWITSHALRTEETVPKSLDLSDISEGIAEMEPPMSPGCGDRAHLDAGTNLQQQRPRGGIPDGRFRPSMAVGGLGTLEHGLPLDSPPPSSPPPLPDLPPPTSPPQVIPGGHPDELIGNLAEGEGVGSTSERHGLRRSHRKSAGRVIEGSRKGRNDSSEESGGEDDDEFDSDAADKVVADLMSKWIDED